MAHVLIVEPNVVLARTYKGAVEHAGHSCSLAADAQQAIDAADGHNPDIVVLELQLGSHDGVEFLHEFRSYTEWATTPVVVHTIIAPTVLAPLSKALQEDFDVKVCLYKPQATLQKLLTTIAGLV
jgi:CheY-like chemotaxis protein